MTTQGSLFATQPDATLPPNGAEPAVATVRAAHLTCAFPSCGRLLDGRQTKYCSPRHKNADYDRLHPRLKEGYLAPRPLPEEPEARRDAGKAIAAANHREDLELARRLALQMLAARGTGTISDLREYAAAKGYDLPWHLPWSGAVFLFGAAVSEGWFEHTGERRNSTHKNGNARKVNVYRLTAAGREALRNMGAHG